jgi:hypothetical protein
MDIMKETITAYDQALFYGKVRNDSATLKRLTLQWIRRLDEAQDSAFSIGVQLGVIQLLSGHYVPQLTSVNQAITFTNEIASALTTALNGYRRKDVKAVVVDQLNEAISNSMKLLPQEAINKYAEANGQAKPGQNFAFHTRLVNDPARPRWSTGSNKS